MGRSISQSVATKIMIHSDNETLKIEVNGPSLTLGAEKLSEDNVIETSIDEVVLVNDPSSFNGKVLIIDGKYQVIIPYVASQNIDEMNKLPNK